MYHIARLTFDCGKVHLLGTVVWAAWEARMES